MPFPNTVCLGERLEGTTRIRNTSECTGEFRTRFRPSIGEDSIAEPQELSPGEEAEFEFVMDRMPDNMLDVEQLVEVRRGDQWIEAESLVDEIEPLFGNLQFVSTPFPGFVQPDEPVSANITVQNAGDCSTIAEMSGTRFTSTSVELGPGETQDFEQRFSMPGNAVPVNLQLTDQERGIQGDEFSTLIEPQQTVQIDQDEGTIQFIGGFDVRLSYRGVIQGTNVESENLDEEDRFIGGRRVSTFSGEISTTPEDKDTILFGNLDFLNVQFGANIQWVLNNEILGEAESFQYSEYPLGVASRLFPVATDDPEIEVKASPVGRLGKVRDAVGVGALIAKNPLLSRTSRGG